MADVALWGIMINQFVQWSVRQSRRGHERLLDKLCMVSRSLMRFMTRVDIGSIGLLSLGRFSPCCTSQLSYSHLADESG